MCLPRTWLFTEFYTEDMYVNYCSEQSTGAGSICVYTEICAHVGTPQKGQLVHS